MWFSNRLFDLFQINNEAFNMLREEVSALKAELSANKTELLTTKANFSWATGRINTLEYENKALMEKAFNIKVPTPQIVRQPVNDDTYNPRDFSFDDIGDRMAKDLGLPVYNEN